MTDVRIFKPAKTAMQSGHTNTRRWVMEFEPGSPKETDPLMGWIGSRDTRNQVRLRFDNKEDAVEFAKKNGYTIHLQEPKARRVRPKSYAENFAPHRPF